MLEVFDQSISIPRDRRRASLARIRAPSEQRHQADPSRETLGLYVTTMQFVYP